LIRHLNFVIRHLPIPRLAAGAGFGIGRRKKAGRRNANHDDPESMDPEHSS